MENRKAAKQATTPRSKSRVIKRNSQTPFPTFPKATKRQLLRIRVRMRQARRSRYAKQSAVALLVFAALITGMIYLLKTFFFNA